METGGLSILNLSADDFTILNWLAILMENRQGRLSTPIEKMGREYLLQNFLAYYQWKTGRTFSDIRESIPMTELLKLYPVLHEASEEKCADTMDRITERRSGISRLQHQRKRCGYSQKELAERSGVNLRTLQQYELKTKDINKASVRTVRSLANVLGCRVEALLEYAPHTSKDFEF
ncbi:MAG: helix-turn-helix domain-containing protein [Eubacteriales bacterium]|nr:helix-turn-helix domain-containing protein [Eubacteriales bacterium]